MYLFIYHEFVHKVHMEKWEKQPNKTKKKKNNIVYFTNKLIYKSPTADVPPL